MQLDILYRTEYTYEPAVSGAVTLLRMRPRTRPGLTVYESTITADPGFITKSYIDAWGTQVEIAEFDRPHSKSQFEVRARVETVQAETDSMAAELAPWEQFLYTKSSERIQLDEIACLGWNVGSEGQTWLSVESFLRWLPLRFQYQVGATDADTTIAGFIEQGAGVCQDFAHVMIAMLRQWGWPARYVSGYFFSAPPEENHRIEAEAMHAWVEAYRPGLGWVGLDATSGQYADDRYVPVGYGRDYGDVSPVRGVLHGVSEQMSVAYLEITRQLPPQQ